MTKKSVEETLFNLDDRRMKWNKHFNLFKNSPHVPGCRQFIQFKERGKKKIKRSTLYSSFIDTVKEFKGGVTANTTVRDRFVDKLLSTRPMQYLWEDVYKFSRSEFKKWFIETWFQNNSKEPNSQEPNDCMFKHIFCGNVGVNNNFEGCHSWVVIAMQEEQGKIKYHKTHRFIPEPATKAEYGSILLAESQLTICHTDGKYYHKKRNTVFVGPSPVFDLALYSHVFLENATQTQSQLYPYPCNSSYEARIGNTAFGVRYNYRDGEPSSAFAYRE